ncbi:MAG: hypothetical protein JJ971_00855 [Balneolaceae bacterium]|nr:hypothetical protein [Balneolaceae bacterium]MBO6544919.1 hypothetical protein [Balneolaceae bacterium]MBO6646315.1 hypothetical protein [Balneolaceae bacterium]
MKNSNPFFLTGASLLFLWIIGGFNPYLSWEQRLFKIAIVGILAFIAWTLKNSEKQTRRKTGLIVVLLLAAGVAYAEPYASDLIFGHHHHHFFCMK